MSMAAATAGRCNAPRGCNHCACHLSATRAPHRCHNPAHGAPADVMSCTTIGLHLASYTCHRVHHHPCPRGVEPPRSCSVLAELERSSQAHRQRRCAARRIHGVAFRATARVVAARAGGAASSRLESARQAVARLLRPFLEAAHRLVRASKSTIAQLAHLPDQLCSTSCSLSALFCTTPPLLRLRCRHCCSAFHFCFVSSSVRC